MSEIKLLKTDYYPVYDVDGDGREEIVIGELLEETLLPPRCEGVGRLELECVEVQRYFKISLLLTDNPLARISDLGQVTNERGLTFKEGQIVTLFHNGKPIAVGTIESFPDDIGFGIGENKATLSVMATVRYSNGRTGIVNINNLR